MQKKTLELLLLFGFVLVSCTNVTLKQDISEYKTQIFDLSQKIRTNPQDAQANRDMGVILVKTSMYEKSKPYLEKAHQLNPDDAQTKLYYGLALEFTDKLDEAFQMYRQFNQASRLSPYRRLLEGRYTLLSQKMAQNEARQVLQTNRDLTNENLSPNLIAVFPLSSQCLEPTYDNLGRGLGEMIITDLSQVPGIELVERIRLNALMEEMALGQTGMVRTGTEAQFGRLLGAGRVITGYFDIMDKNIRLNIELWDYKNADKTRRANTSDALDRMFILEKKLVLGIIANMGIQLTTEQRQKILHIPTRNFHAFLEYCNGLEKQDAGQIKAANAHYKKARRMDPSFEMNQDKVDQTDAAISMMDADQQQILAMTNHAESIPGNRGEVINNTLLNGQYKINHRLQNQSLNIGSNFIPGQDSRETSEEAITAGSNVIIDGEYILPVIIPGRGEMLPDPPPPPGGN